MLFKLKQHLRFLRDRRAAELLPKRATIRAMRRVLKRAVQRLSLKESAIKALTSDFKAAVHLSLGS